MKSELEKLITEISKSGVLYSEAVREFKKLFIAQILRDYHGNQCSAARAMGMHRNTLSRTLAELKMEAGIGRDQRKPVSRYVPKGTEKKLLGRRSG